MHKVTATGPRAAIEAAWDALAWADPTPADAVDAKEESRAAWRLDAYAADEAAAADCLKLIADAAPDLSARAEPLIERDWIALSLEGLPAVTAGRFVVAGGHALGASPPGRTLVRIEAGPAFGTGHHGTTLGCLVALDRLARQRRFKRVLDLGTGTGLLAIAALKAGADTALASDIDAQSVVTARENAALNQVSARFRAVEARGTRHAAIVSRAPYELVFANILSRPLIRLAPEIAAVTAPAGDVILSGLLTHQEPLVRAAYAGRGFALTDRIRRDGWSSLVFHRPPPA